MPRPWSTPKARPDAVSFKRKPSNDAGGVGKPNWGDGTAGGGGGGAGRSDGGPENNDGEGRDAANPRSREVEDTLLAMYEAIDAQFKTFRFAVDDVQAGRCPGYSRIKRLELEYRRAHSEVSAVGNPRVWEPDHDDGYSTP